MALEFFAAVALPYLPPKNRATGSFDAPLEPAVCVNVALPPAPTHSTL